MCEMPAEIDLKDERACKCYRAVMGAYSGLIDVGQSPEIALGAAQIVYGYHHPEFSVAEQVLTVERWVNAGNLH